MKRFDLSRIMTTAWKLFRKFKVTFSEALHRAWISAKAEPINAQRIEDAKAAAGITEECATWKGWKDAGFEVIHEMKALFKVILIYGSRGDNAVYRASFFGRSQVEPIPAE